LRVTSTGKRVVSFRLASTERRFDRSLNAWRDGDTIFYTVTCWRNIGENALESLSKGDPVLVHGRLRDASYEKEGSRHAVFEIEAYSLGHDISRGVSRFARASLVPGGREVVLDDDVEAPGPVAEDADGGGAGRDVSPSAA
jgi:single-strand DNA-binding protein